MPQKPITPGQQSKVTGVRLPRSLTKDFEAQVKTLKEMGCYQPHKISVSALIREIIMEHAKDAIEIFQRKNPRG